MPPLFLERYRGTRYTLDRLKFLYAELLESIGITGEELGQRRGISNNKNNNNPKKATDGDEQSDHSNNSTTLHLTGWLEDRIVRRRRSSFGSCNNNNNNNNTTSNRGRTTNPEIAAAFRFLAATKSPDKEGENGGAAALRDDESVWALSAAKKIERKVVDLIREIGEVVVNGEKLSSLSKRNLIGGSSENTLTYDPCLEYFCEKNMLSLLVDIAKENPLDQTSSNSNTNTATSTTIDSDCTPCPTQHGVVWSPLVKAQVLQTVALLVSAGFRNSHALYYMLSQNAINDLMSCMLPLRQWTDPALEKIVPAFVDLLKNLGLLLAGNAGAGSKQKDLFPFFTCTNTQQEEDTTTFPLLHAALEIGTSTYAQMDSFVHITCLSLIVNIMKIDNPAILSNTAATTEMRKLADHLCQLLLNRFHRMAEQTTGPVVDALRCNAVAQQIKALLQDQIQVLNDVFGCGVSSLNVRLCELLMKRVILVLLQCIESPQERAFIVDVGIPDLDVVPQRESQAQVAMFVLCQLFHYVDYLPFVRMLAVALFHPKSTTALVSSLNQRHGKATSSSNNDKAEEEEDYVIVPTLDAIAQGKLIQGAKLIDNPYRHAFLRTLRGDFGAWRFPVAACVVETVLWSEAMDLETLQILEITPCPYLHEKEKSAALDNNDNNHLDDEKEEKTAEDDNNSNKCNTNTAPGFYKPTTVEEALVAFLTNGPLALSSVSKHCLECAGSLSLSLFYKSTMSVTLNRLHCQSFKYSMTPLRKALIQVKAAYCARALESQKCLGVADHFLELAEAAICNRYKKVMETSSSSSICYHHHRSALRGRGSMRVPAATTGPGVTYACHLSQVGCAAMMSAPENLVRRYRCPKFTDVEEARFNIEMAIYFRTLCKVVRNFLQDLTPHFQGGGGARRGGGIGIESSSRGGPGGGGGLDLVDLADDFALTFGGLRDKPDVGMDLDLRGRMTFPCFLSATPTSSPTKNTHTKEETILRQAATLVLVVDPTDIYVARIMSGTGGTRGKIVCRVAISCVVAAASDSEWLHIAVRHPDVGLLIKNGNMVIQFDKPGTSLIVRQYLDRCRNTVRRELMEKFRCSLEMDAVSVPLPSPNVPSKPPEVSPELVQSAV